MRYYATNKELAVDPFDGFEEYRETMRRTVRGWRTFRGLLGLIGCAAVLAACQSAGQPASAPPSGKVAAVTSSSANGSPSTAAWDALVAAAKQEGKVAVITAPGDVYRQVFDAFQKKYGITVELLVGNSQGDIQPRVDAERKAGQFLWDVAGHAPGVVFNGLKPIGALDPLAPALILPEVTDDASWLGGFAAGWADQGKSLDYMYVADRTWTAYINRTVVPEAQLNKLDQLWDPAWKGKIAIDDPRQSGPGAQKMSGVLTNKGEAKLREFLQNQELVVTQNRRQLAEWVVRGQYPIGLGVAPAILTELSGQGLDVTNVRPLSDDDPASWQITAEAASVAVFNRAPHPNAAKLLVNWLLSREGQETYSKTTGFNSRRTDVAAVDPNGAVDRSVDYQSRIAASLTEDRYPVHLKASAIAKELLK